MLRLLINSFAISALVLIFAKEVKSGNDCEVTEEPWAQAVESCQCDDMLANDGCQLEFVIEDLTMKCRQNAGTSCRSAIASWALAYRNAENANDPKCKDDDPNFQFSQDAWKNCRTDD